MLLAVVFAVGTMVLSRSGFEWLRRDTDGYNLRRINLVLRRLAVGTFLLAAAAGVTLWRLIELTIPSSGRRGLHQYVISYVWEQITGDNQTEEDAGRSDGGY